MITAIITSYYLEAFKADLKKACKQMRVKYELNVGEKYVVGKVPVSEMIQNTSSFSRYMDVYGYDVEIVIPELDKMTNTGYEYLGCIKNDGIITVHPNDNIDFDLSSMNQIKNFPCDRCGRNHSRNIIHVFRKDGEITVYGSTCAKTKFGIDVNQLILKFTRLKEQFGNEGYDRDGEYGKAYTDNTIYAETYTAMAFYEIYEFGYTSASKVDNCGGISTTDSVTNDYILLGDGNTTVKKEFLYNQKYIKFNFGEFLEFCVKFVDEMDAGDFKFNMSGAVDCLEEKWIHPRTKGYVTYLVFRYWSSLNIKKEVLEYNTDYSALPVGHKIKNLVVEIISVYVYEGVYGTCRIYTLRGIEDNIKYKWFASKQLDNDFKYIITSCTVKAHEDSSKYGKSCVITRCRTKIMEDK